jgi:hypothetical protein
MNYTAIPCAVLVLVLCALRLIVGWPQPSSASCPDGYDLRTGIRRTGWFECWPHVVGDPDYDGTWQRPERGVQPPGILRSRIHCTGGSVPIVVNDHTVGCQHSMMGAIQDLP